MTTLLHDLPALPVRGLRAAVGAWALAWDGVVAAARDPNAALERLELRGVRVNRALRRLLRRAEGEAGYSAQRLADGALIPVRLLQAGMSDSSHFAEDEIERQVQSMLDKLGIPNRARIERLSRDIERLSARIDDELERLEHARG